MSTSAFLVHGGVRSTWKLPYHSTSSCDIFWMFFSFHSCFCLFWTDFSTQNWSLVPLRLFYHSAVTAASGTLWKVMGVADTGVIDANAWGSAMRSQHWKGRIILTVNLGIANCYWIAHIFQQDVYCVFVITEHKALNSKIKFLLSGYMLSHVFNQLNR